MIGNVALGHLRIQALRLELAPAIAAREESSLILLRREINLEHALEVGLSENHES
jgi:hypothetical protein